MRKCKGKYWDNESRGYVEFSEGIFHQFSMNFEEFETGAGNYAVAIVELLDGRVVLPPADFIQFIGA